jgi:biopolymer transport protein ExbB/TolQ
MAKPSKEAKQKTLPHSHEAPKFAYFGTFVMIGLAMAFPIALMIFNPTLMFERGWEQFVGTGIFAWALIALGRELARLKANESSFQEAKAMLEGPESIDPSDRRFLPSRIRGLANSKGAPVSQLMELNREGSGLDQEEAAGRFTLPKYILYLLPVIGFIGTVEGISHALMNISIVLPLVKDLDGFMSKLTTVTSALQVAFDSTLLALFLSSTLMLVQTLVHKRSDDLLARIDRWIVENALGKLAATQSDDSALALIAQKLDELAARMGAGLGPHVERFAQSVETLPTALAGMHRGAQAIEKLGESMSAIGTTSETVRRGAASLSRIETVLSQGEEPSPQLDDIKRGVDRTCQAIESLSASWSSSFERSSRASQEQLARTLTSLKDAIDLLQVSMEQGHSLYRNIVKKMLPSNNSFGTYPSDDQAA